MTISSPTAQLAVFTSFTVQTPSRSLARSVSPAQFGQSKVPPLQIPAGISTSRPHLRHQAFGIGPSGETQEALDPAPVEADHHLAVDDRDGRGLVAEAQKLLQGRRVLPDILRCERDTLLRKKLFLSLAARSAGLGVDDDLLRYHVLLSAQA